MGERCGHMGRVQRRGRPQTRQTLRFRQKWRLPWPVLSGTERTEQERTPSGAGQEQSGGGGAWAEGGPSRPGAVLWGPLPSLRPLLARQQQQHGSRSSTQDCLPVSGSHPQRDTVAPALLMGLLTPVCLLSGYAGSPSVHAGRPYSHIPGCGMTDIEAGGGFLC